MLLNPGAYIYVTSFSLSPFVCIRSVKEISCSLWPTPSKHHGCDDSKGTGSTILDASMVISDTRRCAYLCKLQQGDGCCNLVDSLGCDWKDGSNAVTSTVERPKIATAIDCSVIG